MTGDKLPEVMYTPEDLRLSEWDGRLSGVGVKRYSFNGDFDGDYHSTTPAGREEVGRLFNMYPFLQGSVPVELSGRMKVTEADVDRIDESSGNQDAVDQLHDVYTFMRK